MDEMSKNVDVVALENEIALLKQDILARDESIKQLTDDKNNLLKLNQRLQLAVGMGADVPETPQDNESVSIEEMQAKFKDNTLARLFKK